MPPPAIHRTLLHRFELILRPISGYTQSIEEMFKISKDKNGKIEISKDKNGKIEISKDKKYSFQKTIKPPPRGLKSGSYFLGG
jgi:hypothetical protein